jgi:hypothetical protein
VSEVCAYDCRPANPVAVAPRRARAPRRAAAAAAGAPPPAAAAAGVRALAYNVRVYIRAACCSDGQQPAARAYLGCVARAALPPRPPRCR